MPVNDDDLSGFGSSNVVPLSRAAGSFGTNPDSAGKAVQMSQGLGLPPSVIGADLETFQQVDRGQKAAAAIERNGWISDYVARNPMAAEVSADDYDNLEKVSKAVQPFTVAGRQGGLLQAAPEFFLHTIPEMATLLTSEAGRAKLIRGLGKYGEHLADTLGTPGQVQSQGFDIHDPADLDKALGLGLLIGLGKQAPKIENFPRLGRSTSGEIDAFLHDVAGRQTRQDIDNFLAGKAAPDKDPKAVLQIEYAKADAAKLDDAVAAAEATNTKARAPSMLEDFIAGHETENLQLPAAQIADLYRAEGKVPAEGDGLFGFVSGLARDLPLGIETGVELTVPASKYIAHIDPTVHDKIKDFVRFRPEGVTVTEAKELKSEPIEAYHGSPHTFDAFLMEKIGTGEGAQAYGYGLYFAENPEVAGSYKIHDTLTIEQSIAIAFMKAANEDKTIAIADIRKRIADRIDQDNKALEKAANLLETNAPLDLEGGNIYKVVISANREHFLDWNKPLDQQPQVVKDVLDKWNPMARRANNPDFEFHQMLRSKRGAEMLAEAGIPGIKYLDQGSRAQDLLRKDIEALKRNILELESDRPDSPNIAKYKEMLAEKEKRLANPTRNFVVFDPKSVTILERNGERLRNEAVVEETELGLRSLFSEPPPEMTKPEFERYNHRIQDAQQAILDKATTQIEKQKDARQTAEWKAREAEVRTEMQTAVAARPDVATESFLKKGKFKIDSETVDGMLPDNSIPAALKTIGAAHPDDIAPFVGFNSGAELVKGLNDLIVDRKARSESPTRQLDRLINEATAREMETRHGDFGRQIAEEARALALDDIHFDVLSDELRVLANQAGGRPPMGKAELKEWVGNQFASLDTKAAANFTSFQKAAGRAGRDTEKALLAGDPVEAFKAKQRQILSWLLAKESNKFAKEIEKIAGKIDRAQGKTEIASMDQTHFDQLRSMLASVGFTPKHPIPEGLAPLAQFVAESDGQLAVATWLTDGSTRPADPAKLTAEEMRDLGKSIDSMMHVGRAVKTLNSVHGRAELDNVVFDIVGQLERFAFIEQPQHPSAYQMLKKGMKHVAAWNLLVERMLDYTDKFNSNGPITTYLDRPLRDSYSHEIQLNEQVTKKLRELQKFTDTSINDYIPNNVIPTKRLGNSLLDMTRNNLRQLMGYMGSKSGIEKVTRGFGVDETAVWKLINDNATKADWQWVAGMHELHEVLWKESAAMQERVTGVVADAIAPRKMISEKYGEFPGGYWPIKYDRFDSNIAGDLAMKGNLFDPTYVQAVTPHAYTLPRTQYAGALDLTGALGGTHLKATIHDIAFRESVLNANKLISNKTFMDAMRQRWGEEYAGLMYGWIRDIANAQKVDDTYAQGAIRTLSLIRQNMVNTLIAWNPGTYTKHGGTALGMSVATIGARNFAGSAYDFGLRGMIGAAKDIVAGQKEKNKIPEELLDAVKAVTDPTKYGDGVRQFILDSSPLMRNRQRQAMDNVREAYQANIRQGGMQTFMDLRGVMMDVGRVPIAASDALSAFPTWLGEYRTVMEKTGDHAQAVFEADRQVTRSHGSNFIGDKPLSVRIGGNTLGGEMLRMITPLYNFFNHNFNLALQWSWDAGARWKGADEPGANIKSLSNKMFWGFAMAVAMEELAAPALDEHKRGVLTNAFLALVRHTGSWIPGLRDFTNAVAGGYEPSVGFLGTIYKNIYATSKDMNKASKDWLIHTVTSIGFATGMLGSQYGRTASYLKDRFTGTERPPRTWAELRQGLRTGHSKARIHK